LLRSRHEAIFLHAAIAQQKEKLSLYSKALKQLCLRIAAAKFFFVYTMGACFSRTNDPSIPQDASAGGQLPAPAGEYAGASWQELGMLILLAFHTSTHKKNVSALLALKKEQNTKL
jgi:hypothetical protein